jgi:hypothetical protein
MATTTKKGSKNKKARLRRPVVKTSPAKQAQTIAELRHLDEFGEYQISSRVKVTIDDIKRELRGKNLACWCKLSEVCHADVLLEIANG